jgi:ABC-type transport system involved in multi-copper enzyme maturation permease subunit
MVRDALRVLKAEWLRVRRSRATIVGLLFYLGMMAVIYLTVSLAATTSIMGIPSGFFVSSTVCSAAIVPLAFAAAMLAAFSIGREFSRATIHMVWSRPITRTAWLLGKLKAAGLHLGVFFLLTVGLAVLAGGVDIGYSDLAEKDYIIHTEASLWWHFLLAVGLTWLALVGVLTVTAIPAVLLGSPGAALTISIASGFVMQIMMAWESLRPYLLTTYLELPFVQFVAMAKGVPLPVEWGELTRSSLMVTVVWIAICWVCAWWLTKRKEVLN